jgi:hypothetical protein
VDVSVELGDGPVVDVEQVAQRVEAQGVGPGQLEAVELGRAGRNPHSSPTVGRIPFLAITPWIWAFARSRTSGGAIQPSARRPRADMAARSLALRSSCLTRRLPSCSRAHGRGAPGSRVLGGRQRPSTSLGGLEDHLGEWRDSAARQAWADEPSFLKLFMPCLEVCDHMQGREYEIKVTI